MLVGAVVIFVLVMTLLIAALRRPADPQPAQRADSDAGTRVWVWGLGLAFPMATLILLTVYGLFIGERLLPHKTDALVTVQAEARQWAWTFGYGGATATATEGVLHIPAGRPVDVEITSTDVIHSFWVPQLAGKLDAIPGHVNVLRIEATRPGTYAGVSAEFSGTGYREHVFTVRAHDAVSWVTFLREGQP